MLHIYCVCDTVIQVPYSRRLFLLILTRNIPVPSFSKFKFHFEMLPLLSLLVGASCRSESKNGQNVHHQFAHNPRFIYRVSLPFSRPLSIVSCLPTEYKC